MNSLSDNGDLLRYLVRLEHVLADAGYSDAALDIRAAAGSSTGLSTEFLGESLLALRKTVPVVEMGLSLQEREDFMMILEQLEHVFRQRSG